MTHRIHDSLPEGFHFADRLQASDYFRTGSINGAAKVALVKYGEGPIRVSCRLRPPHRWEAIVSEAKLFWGLTGGRVDTAEGRLAGGQWYIEEYKRGWEAGRAGKADADATPAYVDGYRDAAENRMKWHLAYCPDHGDHAEGCQA